MLRTAAVLACLLPATAGADDLESMELASNLGAVLAGGQKCGYTFDNDAVIAFVREHVPADDLGFASMLSTMVTGAGLQLEQMADAAFIAQCAVVEQTAKHYSFMK